LRPYDTDSQYSAGDRSGIFLPGRFGPDIRRAGRARIKKLLKTLKFAKKIPLL
jgi:hypothetical protein